MWCTDGGQQGSIRHKNLTAKLNAILIMVLLWHHHNYSFLSTGSTEIIHKTEKQAENASIVTAVQHHTGLKHGDARLFDTHIPPQNLQKPYFELWVPI